MTQKECNMTTKEALILAAKYNLIAEVKQEINYGYTPEEALREWDII